MKSIIREATTANPRRGVIFGGDINEVPPWHIPRLSSYHSEGYPFHSSIKTIGLSELSRTHLKPLTYTWFSPKGDGQLLDAAYISEAHTNLVRHYRIDSLAFDQKLTDHLGIRLELDY
jgi:hypothetical protein